MYVRAILGGGGDNVSVRPLQSGGLPLSNQGNMTTSESHRDRVTLLTIDNIGTSGGSTGNRLLLHGHERGTNVWRLICEGVEGG